jgi:carotenoid cleavage dioxygenase-like enzyme
VGHWFDGDGAILAVHFTGAGATGIYRYVQSREFQQEERAGKFLYGGYGLLPTGSFWNRFTRGTKNAANTSVLAFGRDRLLALWEGGHPHALDPETLATLGLDDLESLPPSIPFSAHPKRDGQTGEVYNFGISFGKTAMLNVMRVDIQGHLRQRNQFALDGFPLVHDFVMAGRYLVFLISPVRLNLLPALARVKSFGDSFEWKPALGTQVWVIDRETLQLISRSETDPWFQWHFGNGAIDPAGNIVVDVARYSDFQTNQFLKEISTGATQTVSTPTLWQVEINPASGQVTRNLQLLDCDCEFPIVNPAEVGQPWRYTYLTVHRPDTPKPSVFDAIARFDQHTGELCQASLGQNCYPVEPIYAPDAEERDRGWIVSVVYDANADKSEVWVWDSDRIDDAPVCRLALPEVIPIGFHGTWRPA